MLDAENLEAPEGTAALAAADLLARLVSGSDERPAYSDEVHEWIGANDSSPPDDLVADAVAVR